MTVTGSAMLVGGECKKERFFSHIVEPDVSKPELS